MPIVMLRKKSNTYDKQLQRCNKIQESFEEIANTYLKTSSSPNGKPAGKHKKKSFAIKAPWIVASAALLIAIFIFISNSSFDIRIRILNKTPLVDSASASDPASGLSGHETMLLRGGQIASPIVGRAVFVGDALGSSKVYSNEIVLSNADGQGSASYRIEFKKPLDLSKSEIGYFAKAAALGTRLILVITDTDNKAFRVEDNQVARLSKEWRAYSVNLVPVKGVINLTSISNIRFEFGSPTAGNPPNTAVFLKDVYLAKSKRFKWL